MERWNQLTRHEKETLASRYGVSCKGDMVPFSEQELEKVPAPEWDRLLQKEVPVRKVKEKTEKVVEVKKEKVFGSRGKGKRKV